MENKFLSRGKRIDNGEWVEGYHAIIGGKPVIIEKEPEKYYDVDGGENRSGNKILKIVPGTICQCTGYEGIYEKDIFRYEDEDFVIKWSDDSLSWKAVSIFTDESVSLAEFNPDYMDVIGNDIDNPELLEV